jgi:hypothetical protein
MEIKVNGNLQNNVIKKSDSTTVKVPIGIDHFYQR